MIQLYIYMYLFFFRFFFLINYYKILCRSLCYRAGPLLVIYFTHSSVKYVHPKLLILFTKGQHVWYMRRDGYRGAMALTVIFYFLSIWGHMDTL